MGAIAPIVSWYVLAPDFAKTKTVTYCGGFCFAIVVRMMGDDFELLVEIGFEKLPQWVRERIKNVAILVEDEPSEEDRRLQGLSEGETLLGLYKGIPLSERGELYGVGMTLPDTITLYRKPIEQAAEEDGLPIAQVIAETIWHEFAHHFGMDEYEVQLREDIRDGRLDD